MQCVCGVWGHERMAKFQPTVGANKKGGMTVEALFECFKKNIVALHPDAQGTPTKRVIVKIDSGPGRMNKTMLAHMRSKGFHSFPGVPNTTLITQETNQNHGPFKCVCHNNVNALSAYHFSRQ